MLTSYLGEQYTSATKAVLNLIPQDEIDICITRGKMYSDEKWWWGDRANKWSEMAMKKGEKLTIGDAQRALSQVSGIPQRTLRYYADHARFFEPEIREHYDVLPFSHFTTAKRFGPRWNEILEKSLDYLEEYNKLASAEYLEWFFSRNAQPVLEIDGKLLSEMNALEISMPESDEEWEEDPKASQAIARDWISKIDQQTYTINQSIAMLPVSPKAKEKLQAALKNLHEAFEDAIKEISIPR